MPTVRFTESQSMSTTHRVSWRTAVRIAPFLLAMFGGAFVMGAVRPQASLAAPAAAIGRSDADDALLESTSLVLLGVGLFGTARLLQALNRRHEEADHRDDEAAAAKPAVEIGPIHGPAHTQAAS